MKQIKWKFKGTEVYFVNGLHFSTFVDLENLIFIWSKEGSDFIETEITKDKVCIGKHTFKDLKSLQQFFFKED